MADDDESVRSASSDLDRQIERWRTDAFTPPILQRLIEHDFNPIEIIGAAHQIEANIRRALEVIPRDLDNPTCIDAEHLWTEERGGDQELQVGPLAAESQAPPSFQRDRRLHERLHYRPWENPYQPEQIILSGRVFHPSVLAFECFEERWFSTNDRVALWEKIQDVLGSKFNCEQRITPYGISPYSTAAISDAGIQTNANFYFHADAVPARELNFRPWLDDNRPDRITVDGKHIYPSKEAFDAFSNLYAMQPYMVKKSCGALYVIHSAVVWRAVETKLGSRAYFDIRLFPRDVEDNHDKPDSWHWYILVDERVDAME